MLSKILPGLFMLAIAVVCGYLFYQLRQTQDKLDAIATAPSHNDAVRESLVDLLDSDSFVDAIRMKIYDLEAAEYRSVAMAPPPPVQKNEEEEKEICTAYLIDHMFASRPPQKDTSGSIVEIDSTAVDEKDETAPDDLDPEDDKDDEKISSDDLSFLKELAANESDGE